MSGFAWAVLAFISGLGFTVLGDMVSEEVRDRLDLIPYTVLKLAARRLEHSQRAAVYAEEWLPELTYILKGAETRPITRLFTGTRYALGILASARRIARHLQRSAPVQPVLAASIPPSSKAEVAWQFWSRYRRYLQEAKLMPAMAVHQLDEVTDRVLEMLEDPAREGPWRHSGLVVAAPQSGMTGNCIGLACKAADAGYKLIVVMTDNHNLVRSQTQVLVDEGFIGFDSQHLHRNEQEQRYIGAGDMIDSLRLGIISLTTSDEDGDFKRRIAAMNGPIGDHPVVLVIKKNSRVLKHVQQWIMDYEGRPAADGRWTVPNLPVLVIDTQADTTSLNIAALDKDVTLPQVDVRIRHLLEGFDKYAYVGYTSNPFANSCLQLGVGDKKDDGGALSREFIVSVKASSTYLGPERVFGCQHNDSCGGSSPSPLPIVRLVADHDSWMPDRHKKDWIPPLQLPDSLAEAISAFVLTCAARQARGQIANHKTMLIHATRFKYVQNRITDQVRQHLQLLKDRISFGVTAEDDFRSLWERDFVNTSLAFPAGETPPTTWGEVWSQVRPVIEEIQVQSVNGTETSPLQYREHRQEGMAVIAVGGNTLPREFTLEGLTVSYYLQASTLSGALQVSHSFGYRSGYEDLCRLYMTLALYDAWVEITDANEEFRRNLPDFLERGMQ